MNFPLKSLVHLWVTLADSFNTNTRSLETFKKSSNQHYLTVVLPTLGKALDAGLTTGYFEKPMLFKSKSSSSALPAFLYEFMSLIFDDRGLLLDMSAEQIEAIRTVRQLTFIFYKFEHDFTPAQQDEAYSTFVERDSLVKTDYEPHQIDELRTLIELYQLQPDVSQSKWCHSNGATAYGGSSIVDKLSSFRVLKHAHLAKSLFHNYAHARAIARPELPCPSKLTLVPKDSRGPRIICMEPHENMYIQKGVQNLWYDHIQDKHLCLSAGRINFTSQEVNRSLAYRSSIDRSYATIDLKDASDLVSYELVRSIFDGEFLDLIEISRSTHYTVNDMLYAFKKFAPMGSALCFPVEAVLFFAIAACITDDVYVYGDDIIVPTDKAHDVCQHLELYGMKVNATKTLIKGNFRESCGGEYYHGYDIGYVKYRSNDIVSSSAFTHELSRVHTGSLASLVTEMLESDTGIFLPRSVRDDVSFVSRFHDRLTPNDVFLRRKWNADLQRYEYRSLSVCNINKGTPASDDLAYYHWLNTFAFVSEDDVYLKIDKAWRNELYKVRNNVVLLTESSDRVLALYPKVYSKLKYKWDTLV